MKTWNWLMSLITKLVAFHVRPRSVGLAMMAVSATVFVAALGSGYVIQWTGADQSTFRFSTGDGPFAPLTLVIVTIAGIMFLAGGWLAYRAGKHDNEVNQLSRVLVVELRGLVDTADAPLLRAVPRSVRGRRIDCLVDVRCLVGESAPVISEALNELADLRRQLRRDRGDTAREHVTVVVGGIMQIPLLFFVGTLIEDEGKVVLMDWERTARKWQELDQPDDGSRFSVSGMDAVPANTADVVMIVSASYLADLDGIAQTFPGYPTVHLQRPDPKPNTLWSEDTQATLTNQFLTTLAKLANLKVRTVHLVLAAPATLSIRFGQSYDHRNMPDLLCYQRERDHIPPYPWSIKMPKAESQPAQYILTPSLTMVEA